MTGTADEEPLPHLRPADDDDAWGVIALIGGCWSEYPGCVMDVHGECPDLLAPATAYRGQGGAFWVATDGCGTVVGTVGWRPLPEGAFELERLYVNPRWRHRGLGTRLTGLVEKAAVAGLASRVELWSDTRFEAAHRLYERVGFVSTSKQRELRDLSNTRERHFVKVLTWPAAGQMQS